MLFIGAERRESHEVDDDVEVAIRKHGDDENGEGQQRDSSLATPPRELRINSI